MPEVQLEPKWVVNFRSWWEGLIGPTLTEMWEDVRKKVGTPGLLESTYGETVRRFEVELNKLVFEASDFAAAAGQSEWAPYAAAALDVAHKVNAQWKDPKATTPTSVSGAVNAVATVVRGVNVGVTSIGVAWALASLAEVVRARKLLAQWEDHMEDGVPPSRRDARRAGIEGSVFGGEPGYPVATELDGYAIDGELDGYGEGYDVDSGFGTYGDGQVVVGGPLMDSVRQGGWTAEQAGGGPPWGGRLRGRFRGRFGRQS